MDEFEQLEILERKHAELHRAFQSWQDALARSPYDIGECIQCGKPVVCLPDGMPRCVECEDKTMLICAKERSD